MKPINVNTSNTVGHLQFSKDDQITTIGTYNKKYLFEALNEWIRNVYDSDALTLGIYNSNGKNNFNMLCITDGKDITCVAPIHDDEFLDHQPKFPRAEIIYTESQQKLIEELSKESPEFKKHIGKIISGE